MAISCKAVPVAMPIQSFLHLSTVFITHFGSLKVLSDILSHIYLAANIFE